MGEKPIYSKHGIQIIEDAISFIRKRPSSFVGSNPSGAYLVGRLTQDLILLGACSLRIVSSGSWYSISAGTDWLTCEDGSISFVPFQRLMPMPSGGKRYDRTEVILTALADAVVTSGVDGTTWISGEPDHWDLPNDIASVLDVQSGRVVAFHFSKLAEAADLQRA